MDTRIKVRPRRDKLTPLDLARGNSYRGFTLDNFTEIEATPAELRALLVDDKLEVLTRREA